MVVKFKFQSVFVNSQQNPRQAFARGREGHSSCILSFDLIGQHQNKKFTSWKSFCCSGSQTLFFGGREATTENTSAVRRLSGILNKKKRDFVDCNPQALRNSTDEVFLRLNVYNRFLCITFRYFTNKGFMKLICQVFKQAFCA